MKEAIQYLHGKYGKKIRYNTQHAFNQALSIAKLDKDVSSTGILRKQIIIYTKWKTKNPRHVKGLNRLTYDNSLINYNKLMKEINKLATRPQTLLGGLPLNSAIGNRGKLPSN